jgi:hypothetical protein
MSIMDTSTQPPELASAPADIDNEFDLDIRIAVVEDADLPTAGFSCSWYTCTGCGGSGHSAGTKQFCCA